MAKTDNFQPSGGTWKEWATKPGLQSVLDPSDGLGIKNHYIDTIHKMTIDLVANLSKESYVLDYGCGKGRIAQYLTSKTGCVLGADITEEMLVSAKKESKNPHLNFFLVDGKNLPIKQNSLDLIITVGVLQYVVQDRILYHGLLQEFSRLLKPNGQLIMIEQVSLTNEMSGSVKKANRLEDYLNLGNSTDFKLIKNCVIRLGSPRKFECLTVLRGWFPQYLYRFAIWVILRRNMTLKYGSLRNQPYVDSLFFLENKGEVQCFSENDVGE